MSKLIKPMRWRSEDWEAVEREADLLGIPPTSFVRLFVLAGIAPTGLDDKVKKAQRWFKKRRLAGSGDD